MIVKKIAVITLFASQVGFGISPVFSQSYSYSGSGYNDDGYVYGDINAQNGSRYVDGYVVDENGDEKYFSGDWVGHGEVEGYDEDGNYVYLEVD